MPSTTEQTIIDTFDSPAEFPHHVWESLRCNPTNFNVILPLAEKALSSEQCGRPVSGQFWLVCISYKPHPVVELVLSCTRNEIGEYPIFIATTIPVSQLSSEFLEPRLYAMASSLREVVPVARVYSVFAPDPIALIFAELWTELTDVQSYSTPYYAAKLSFCTSGTFINSYPTADAEAVYDLRPATPDDLGRVADLCFAFAKESPPFVLSSDEAREEATVLIRNEQVWVHEVRSGNAPPEIACIVAFTRNTNTTATITKVCTNPRWRSRGCAQRLVRRVCKHLLTSKESVALYVAHDNTAAARVYHCVGFVGLDSKNSVPVEGVDGWMEIGFDRERVNLGHW